MAPLGRLPATSCPVVPGIPPAVILPVGFEPSRLPTLGRSRQHRPGFHLQSALFAASTCVRWLAGQGCWSLQHSRYAHVCRGWCIRALCCDRRRYCALQFVHFLPLLCSFPFLSVHHPQVNMAKMHRDVAHTAVSTRGSNCRRTSPAPTNWDNRR